MVIHPSANHGPSCLTHDSDFILYEEWIEFFNTQKEYGRRETGDRKREKRDRRREKGYRRRETGDRRRETGDGIQETGERRRET